MKLVPTGIMARLDPPAQFSFRASEWPEWIEEFGRFRKASKLHKEDGDVQRDTLLYVMGGKQANKIFKTLKFETKEVEDPDDPSKTVTMEEKDTDYDVLVRKFTDYFVPKNYLIHVRCLFQERRQHSGESVEEFARELQSMVQRCNYKEAEDLVRDRFVTGLRDQTVKQKLQLTQELSLEKAVTIARQHEDVKKQLEEQQQQAQVEEARAHPRGGARSKAQKQEKGSESTPKTQPAKAPRAGQPCDRCGYETHKRGKCPATGQTCRKCKKRGHFASMCQGVTGGNHRGNRHTDEVAAQPPGVDYFLGAVDSAEDSDAWMVPLEVCGTSINFKIDTGADISVMSHTTFQTLPRCPVLQPAKVMLSTPGGKPQIRGEFTAVTTYKDKVYEFRVVVIESTRKISLLARDIAAAMGLVKRIEELVEEMTNVNDSEIGLMKTSPVEIKLKDGAQPHCVTTARRIPFPREDGVKAELQRMLDNGVIRQVTEPTDWCAAIVAVPKSSGALRICVDLKQLNKAVRREHYTLPSLEDIAPRLRDSKVFSKLDAASGFGQIPLDEKSQLLTTFITPFGRYAFRRVPFGITSAPEIFQRKMAELLEGLEGVEVIMDDILVHGRTVEEHDRRLAAVLRRIHESGMRLNKAKCLFRVPELIYFGHRVGQNGVRPGPEKVKALRELEAPTNVSELRTVLGMFQFLGRFLSHLSTVINKGG